MKRRLILSLALLIAAPAVGQRQHPPFTMKFETALSAYGQCLRGAVDRTDPALPAKDAAASAVGACENDFGVAQEQLADDYVTRQGVSEKSAAKFAARDMRRLRADIQKTVFEQAQANRRVTQ